MKNLVLLFTAILISVSFSFSQSPQAFKYQAVVRDAAGDILDNQLVSFRIGIRDVSAVGTLLYQETFTLTTNQFGLASVEIGNGTPTPVSGIFADIDWGTNSKFLEVELDPDGGIVFSPMGTTQILSVPYALYAEEAGNSDDGDWTILGDNMYAAVPGNVGIGTSNPITPLHVHGRGAFGNTVNSTKANRALNLIATDAVMRIWRTTDNTAFDPGVEIIWGNQPSQGDEGNFWWDFHLKGSDGSFNIRDRSFGQGNESRLAIDTSGNVGLGTTTPDERLDVDGGIRVGYSVGNNAGTLRWAGTHMEYYDGTQWLPFASGSGSQWSQSGSNIFYDVGNVGIGTSSPADLLSLAGDNPYLTFDASASSHEMGMRFSHGGILKYSWDFDETSNDITFNWDQDNTGTGDIQFKRYGDPMLAFRNDGNVGIGTSTPTSILEIEADDPVMTLDASTSSNTLGIDCGQNGIVKYSWDLDLASNDVTFNWDQDNTGTGDINFKRHGDDRLAIRNNGYVGIGTSLPYSILTLEDDNPYLTFDASASSHEMGLRFSHGGILKYSWDFDETSNDIIFNWDQDNTGTGDIQFKRYGDPMLAFRNDGNVGIGTAIPQKRLTIQGEETDIRLDIDSGSPILTEGLEFAVDGIERSSIQLEKSTNNLIFDFDKNNSGIGDIQFKRYGDPMLAIRNDGNVGIGTSTPTRTLDVNGETRIGIMNQDDFLDNIVVADVEGVLHIRDAATLGGGSPTLWAEMGPDIHNINPGMVGIGTPMPTHTLDVNGEARIEIMNLNNALENVVVADELGVLHIRDAATLGGFEFSEHVKIDANGNVGIGTDAPTAKAHIKDVLRLEPRDTFPPTPEEGDIFVHALDHNIYCFLNGIWQQLNN